VTVFILFYINRCQPDAAFDNTRIAMTRLDRINLSWIFIFNDFLGIYSDLPQAPYVQFKTVKPVLSILRSSLLRIGSVGRFEG